MLLCGKQHAVFRFVVNLDLGMVRSHVALPTSARQAGDGDGCGRVGQAMALLLDSGIPGADMTHSYDFDRMLRDSNKFVLRDYPKFGK